MTVEVATKRTPLEGLRQSPGEAWWKKLVPPLIALILVVAIWWPLTIPLRGFLPTPLAVLEAFLDAWTNPVFYGHLIATFRRVVIGAVTAFVAGLAIGVFMGRSKIFEAFSLPWVMVALALPGPVVILFTILILGLEENTLLIALWVSVTPFVVNIVYEGVKSLDPDLFDMSVVYRWSSPQRYRDLIMPQLAPSLFSAGRFGFALSWKIVVIIEALSLPNGIGGQLEHFFRLLRPDRVVAWTLCFTVVMTLVDFLLFRPTEKRVFAWRKEAVL
jgi:NitT/TauT family transport system permease protein